MDDARYLEDGRLTIFKRSGTYYARLRISPGKYLWRSLKTSDEQTAIKVGRRLLFQMEQRAEQGLPPKSKLFAAVIDVYITYRERDHAHGKTSAGMLRQIIRVSKFWREYAGELLIEDIDDKVMREFIPWRRDYYSRFETLPKNARDGLADLGHASDQPKAAEGGRLEHVLFQPDRTRRREPDHPPSNQRQRYERRLVRLAGGLQHGRIA